MEWQNGMVAVLDALGVSQYDDAQIERFLVNRSLSSYLLGEKAVSMGLSKPTKLVSQFIFNDTVAIGFARGENVSNAIMFKEFATLLRRLMADSLVTGIAYRGAISSGRFVVDSEPNDIAIMGQPVSDAAEWYNKAEWAGIMATPRTSYLIRSVASTELTALSRFLVEYDVPLKQDASRRLFVVNWPVEFTPLHPHRPEISEGPPERKISRLLERSMSAPEAVHKLRNTREFATIVLGSSEVPRTSV